MSHTPGPWVAEMEHGCKDIGPFVRGLIYSVCVTVGIGEDADRANARLIAAAPDLLAALRRILSVPKRADGDTTEWDTACAKGWAAIAKVEEET